MDDRLHIGIVVEQRYLSQAQPAGLIQALQARDHYVTIFDPQAVYEMGKEAWLEGFDLIVARGRSWELLCLLGWAEARGIPTLNRRAAIAAVHNKADMAVALATGRIPTPRTFLGGVERLAAQIPGVDYPLIVKPIFGDNGRGLYIVRTPAELAGLSWPEPVALVQQFLPSDGYDVKLYGIGSEVWAVRKPSPLSEPSDPARPAETMPITLALRELGRRCGELFGLELYGADCIQTRLGPIVIEVNDFPNYTGLPWIDRELADYTVNRTKRNREARKNREAGADDHENRNDYAAASTDPPQPDHAGCASAADGMGRVGRRDVS